nr:hypothetical protein [uncultured Cohaesibacter sp.]
MGKPASLPLSAIAATQPVLALATWQRQPKLKSFKNCHYQNLSEKSDAIRPATVPKKTQWPFQPHTIHNEELEEKGNTHPFPYRAILPLQAKKIRIETLVI